MNQFKLDMIQKYGFPDFDYKERSKPSSGLIYGAGINDSPFITEIKIDGIRYSHKAYLVWKSLLGRCFSAVEKEKHPTYVNTTCCKEWLLFTNFARWFKDNYISGYHLDKDLLVEGNEVYGPDTCIFIPQDINSFLTLSNKNRGLLPIGVSAKSGKYVSQIGGNKQRKHLGYFNSKEEAHRAWQKAKLEQAIAFNFQPLQRVINKLIYEIDNNLETKTL